MEKRKELICEECGWKFPEELLESYLQGNSIYCEKCGKENFKNITQEKSGISLKTSNSIKKAYSSVKKKSVIFKDKVKQRLKDLREKYDKT